METTTQHPMSQPGMQPSFNDKVRHSKALIPTLAVMAVAVAALATTLMVSRANSQSGQYPVTATAEVPAATNVVTPKPAYTAQAPVRAPLAVQAAQPVRSVPAPHQQTSHQQASYQQPSQMQPAPVQVAQVCHTCGVVESSTAVQRQGEVNGIGNSQIGLGTIAGGLLGAVLGNQVGHGNGRTAATVLGAAGGAYAGNAVQKNMSKVTVYDMRIRMNDGSFRTIEQSNPISSGTQVYVEGNSIRVRG
jgi:outer membrane lipoprotein SlyB